MNLVLWACTAKQWRGTHPEYAKKGLNIRDTASINELVVFANLESFNAEFLKRDMDTNLPDSLSARNGRTATGTLNAIDAEKGFRKLEAKK